MRPPRGTRPRGPGGAGAGRGLGTDEILAGLVGAGLLVVAARRGWPRVAHVLVAHRDASVAAAALAVAGAVAIAATVRASRARRGPSRRLVAPLGDDRGARWARPGELRALWADAPASGRLALGTLGRRQVCLEAGHSLLVVGPTQSGKTTGLAVPALLEWDGPVVATSVKTDLLAATHPWRARLGRVLVYDPAGVAGRARAAWSPLAGATSWAGARRSAAGLCSVARAGAGSGIEDAGFWYATAEKLLAPLLLAAVRAGGSMGDVVRWVDTAEVAEVVLALELADEREALQAAEASFAREERQRSSVYTTAETVLAAFADPLVAACSDGDDVQVERLLGGGCDTLYLVSPAHEQDRLQAPFVCLLRSVLDTAFSLASRRGAPLDPPLLVVLDEAANVAPLAGLDGVVATAASHGIQVVTLWQDLAQVEARHGSRAATVVNNHRAKLVCPGVSDPATLDQVRRLVGEAEAPSRSTTRDPAGGLSSTTSIERRPLAPPDLLRRLAPGEAVLLYAGLLPARVRLRPFYADRRLAARAAGRLSAAARPRGRRAARRRGRRRRRRQG